MPAIDLRSGHDHRDPAGHELEALGAEGFIAEALSALRNDPEVGGRHQPSDGLDRHRALEPDASRQTELVDEAGNGGARRTVAVDVELRVRHPRAGECE